MNINNTIKQTCFAFAAIFCAILVPSKLYAEQNAFMVEASTMGFRLGYSKGSWDIFTRFDADFSGKTYESTEYADDSITYDGSSSSGNSNLEFGLGVDKFWILALIQYGIRSEVSYKYPYTTDQHEIKYDNTINTCYRIAMIAKANLDSWSFGGSLGPTLDWKYRHYISEFQNAYDVRIRFNRTSNITNIDMQSELFARYEF